MNKFDVFDTGPSIESNRGVLGLLEIKALGAFYTPYWLAYSTIEKIGESVNLRTPTMAIDVSCGDGVFLCAYLNYLKSNFPKRTAEEILSLVGGIDVDKSAIKNCKANLMYFYKQSLAGKKQKAAEKILDENILHGNALAIMNTSGLGNTFPSTRSKIVVGNPPWRLIRNRRDYKSEDGQWSFQRLSTEKMLKAKEDWRSDGALMGKESEGDLYLQFLDAIIRNASDLKAIGLILPDSFITNTNSGTIRSKLLSDFAVDISGYTNTFGAFEADVRKKFLCVVAIRDLEPKKLKAHFGLKAGRENFIGGSSESIAFGALDLSRFTSRGILPDLRTKSELVVMRQLSQTKARLGALYDISGKSSIVRRSEIVRGADIKLHHDCPSQHLQRGKSYSLAWRKVTKDDNTRTLNCSILCDSEVTDQNSVHRMCGLSIGEALRLYAVMSSIVADFFIKTQITVNITKEIMADLPIPNMTDANLNAAAFVIGHIVFKFDKGYLAQELGISKSQSDKISKGIANISSEEAFALCDLHIAKTFGIDGETFIEILKSRFRTFLRKNPLYAAWFDLDFETSNGRAA